MMTKISLLGTFHLAYFVSEWNNSSDTELKKYIKGLLLSENAVAVQKALARIESMFDSNAKDDDFIRSMGSLDCFVFGPLFRDSPEAENNTEQRAREDNANADVATYFGGMFRLGYLEKLPMPKFGYEMPSKA